MNINIQCKQILAEAEDSLREFEQKVSEMRSRGETLQPNQLTQELLKLQVHTHLSPVVWFYNNNYSY